MKKIHKFYFLALLLTVITGCSETFSNDARQSRPYEVRHPITLEKEQNSIEVPIHLDGSSFTTSEESRIKSFLYAFNNQGNSKLIITVPENGAKVASARIAVKNVVEIADLVGVEKDDIRIGTYRPLNDITGGVRLYFDSVIAVAPDCSNKWTKNLADASDNDHSDSFGCSNRANLAKMIARPEDLVNMKTMASGSAQRRISVLNSYVLGQVTSAARDAQESASSR